MTPRSAVIAVLACLTVTGCASALSTRTITNPIPAPWHNQLAGTALRSALLPLSAFPAGYKVDSSESSDTGATLLSGSASPAPAPDSRNCLQLVQATNSPMSGLTAGVFEVLYDATMNHRSTLHQRLYSQRVLQFATTSASTEYFGLVRFTASRCPSLKGKDGTTTIAVRQTVRPASPVAGHKTLLAREMGAVKGVDVEAEVLYAIDGTSVYVVSATASGVPPTAKPSSLAALMLKLITREQAFKCALACTTAPPSAARTPTR